MLRIIRSHRINAATPRRQRERRLGKNHPLSWRFGGFRRIIWENMCESYLSKPRECWGSWWCWWCWPRWAPAWPGCCTAPWTPGCWAGAGWFGPNGLRPRTTTAAPRSRERIRLSPTCSTELRRSKRVNMQSKSILYLPYNHD